MRIIRGYLFRSIAARVLLVLLVLLGLTSFIELIGELDNLGEGTYGLPQAFYYVILKIPARAYVIMPMAALLGALLALGALASHSEIIVLRAAGISSGRLAVAVGATGVVFGLVTLALGEFIGPSLEGYGRQYRTLARKGQSGARASGAAWVRDGDAFIHLGTPDENLSYGGVLMYRVRDGALIAVSHASSVDVSAANERDWVLNNFAETRFESDRVSVYSVPQLLEPKNLSSELLSLMQVRPSTLTGERLWRYVRYLRANDLDSRRYEINYWARLAQALAVVPMCVLALPFSFGSLRSSGTSSRMLVGVIIGLAYFLGSQTLADGGAVFGIAPWLVAAGPTVLLSLVAWAMLARAR